MKRLMELLNVKEGEEFILVNPDGVRLDDIYKFNNNELEIQYDGEWVSTYELNETNDIIARIVLEGLTARPLPFKPKEGETYYIAVCETLAVDVQWFDSNYDLTNFYADNCFRTKEEALEHAKEIRKKLLDKYENA